MTPPRTTLVVLLALLVDVAAAADGVDAGRVEVERFDGGRTTGVLVRCDEAGIGLRTQDETLEIETRDLVSVRRLEIPARERPTEPPRTIVEIANGDRLAARPLSADEDALRVQWSYLDAEPIDVPLETVRSVAWHLPRERSVRESVLSRLRGHAGEGDRLESENGGAVLGEFRGLADDQVSIAIAGSVAKVPITGLRGLTFDPALVSVPETPSHSVIVDLIDGTRVTASSAVLDGEQWRIEPTFGTTFTMPSTSVASLRFVGGRAADLSDREPVEAEQRSWFGPKLEWQRDLSVVGVPLQIGERGYAKGVGVHGHSRLVYAVESGDRSFRATVGIDATADTGGSVQFVVRLDGDEVHRTAVVRGGDAPQTIGPFDLTGSKQLELVVETADRGDVLDRANWCDALIVRD